MKLLSWLELIIFNAIWAMCIFWQGKPLALVVALMGVLALITYRSWTRDLAVLLVIGLTFDTVATVLGLFRFSETLWILPYWLILIWVSFVMTLNSSLDWCRQLSTAWRALIFGVAGLFSYSVALKYGAYSWGAPATWVGGWLLFSWIVIGMVSGKSLWRGNEGG